MYRFFSKSFDLMIPLPAVAHQATQGGLLVTTYITPGMIRFVGGNFTTEDENIATFLRKYKTFGKTIFEYPKEEPEKEVREEMPLLEQIEEVSSRNEAIIFLKQKKGIAPETFKGMKKKQIIELAKQHRLEFPNWDAD